MVLIESQTASRTAMTAPLKAIDGNDDLSSLMNDLATQARAAARLLSLAPPEQ
jgi:glutamate-5-semialdehyde dehydrogenase